MTTHLTVSAVTDRIHDALRDEGRSVAWLSMSTGIADKTLRRKLVDPDRFTLSELSAISTALGIDLEQLVAGPPLPALSAAGSRPRGAA